MCTAAEGCLLYYIFCYFYHSAQGGCRSLVIERGGKEKAKSTDERFLETTLNSLSVLADCSLRSSSWSMNLVAHNDARSTLRYYNLGQRKKKKTAKILLSKRCDNRLRVQQLWNVAVRGYFIVCEKYRPRFCL